MKHFTPQIEVIFIHQDEVLPNDFDYLPTPNSLNTKQLSKWKSRRAAHFLLTTLFQKHKLDLTLLENIQRTESGRPFINLPQIDFNISHSGEWVAVIFSNSFTKLAVGIDIEHPQKVRRYTDLIRYYANTEEQEVLLNKHCPLLENLAQRFYLSWCLREAVLKSQGIGIVKLSEVKHIPLKKQIFSAYCPSGKLHFITELPFYLSYFYQQPENMILSTPKLFQWQFGELLSIDCHPIIYDVNLRTTNA